jgi:hypothetical protein
VVVITTDNHGNRAETAVSDNGGEKAAGKLER